MKISKICQIQLNWLICIAVDFTYLLIYSIPTNMGAESHQPEKPMDKRPVVRRLARGYLEPRVIKRSGQTVQEAIKTTGAVIRGRGPKS